MTADRPTQTQAPVAVPALKEKSSIAGWRFWLPLFLQVILIGAGAAQAVYTYTTGTTVVLQTVPVDPYDLLRGYSQTVRYDISNLGMLRSLPGGNELSQTDAADQSFPIYVTLESPTQQTPMPPSSWTPVAVSATYPKQLGAHQIAIQGRYRDRQVVYGLESYYMPEDQRTQINAAINQAQDDQRRPFLVEVKVDNQGHSVPVSLWVEDKNYRF